MLHLKLCSLIWSLDKPFQSALVQGEYGAQSGLIVSYPCQWINGEHRIITDIEHGEFAQQAIMKSFAELASEAQTVSDLGLLKG